MMIPLYVALGGGIGAVARYFVTVLCGAWFGSNYPYGTFAVNVLGSLLMGILIGYMAKTLPHSLELRAFLALGVLGGFTTFSSSSLDAL